MRIQRSDSLCDSVVRGGLDSVAKRADFGTGTGTGTLTGTGSGSVGVAASRVRRQLIQFVEAHAPIINGIVASDPATLSVR